MSYKIIFQLLFYGIAIYACVWIFNHINPWVSFMVIIAIIAYLINKFINFIKKQQ